MPTLHIADLSRLELILIIAIFIPKTYHQTGNVNRDVLCSHLTESKANLFRGAARLYVNYSIDTIPVDIVTPLLIAELLSS